MFNRDGLINLLQKQAQDNLDILYNLCKDKPDDINKKLYEKDVIDEFIPEEHEEKDDKKFMKEFKKTTGCSTCKFINECKLSDTEEAKKKQYECIMNGFKHFKRLEG